MKKLSFLMTLSMMLVSFWGFSQQLTITGNVADDNSLALPGATVLVEGTSNGVTTDFDGNYSIVANVGDVLVFSYVGFDTQTVTVGRDTKINILLNSSNELEEVVVTGITTRNLKRSTSSTVVVDAAQIEGVAMTSPDAALQGRVAGLRVVSQSGTPGSPTSIRIRGEGSITGNNSPIFVIDGVPVVNGSYSPLLTDLGVLSMINPNDIENITVLKDASATAPYGARGSNGVIVITTKSGSAGEVKYQVSSSYGFQNYAMDERPMLTGNQRLELAAEMIMNDYGWSRERATNNILGRAGYRTWDAGGRVDGDWENAVKVKDAPDAVYNFSASGGNATENFRLSIGHRKTMGTSIGLDYENISGSFNYRKKAGKLEINTSTRISNSIQLGQLESSAYFGAPQMTRIFMPAVFQPFNADGTPNINLETSIFNTVYVAQNNINKLDGTRALTNNSLTYTFNENLKFTTRYSIDYNMTNTHQFNNKTHGDGRSDNGYAYQSNRRNFTWAFSNQLKWDKTFNDVHYISALAQMSFQKNKYDSLSASGENVAADGLYYVGSFNTNETGYGFFSDWKELGYLGILNYSYDDKYIVDLSYRYDGSSRFAADYRFGSFWSAAVAWNLSEEDFLADSDIINSLKLRGSIGETGSNGVGLNSYQSLFGYGGSYDDNGAVAPSSFGNAILTWEKQTLYDIGLEYSILDNRVSGSIVAFNRETSDLLQSVPLSRTTGHTSQSKNIGEVRNKGFEFEFSADVIKADNFTWNIYSNYATLDNEVTSLAKDAAGNDINIDGGTQRTRVGEELRGWYMRQWAGVNSQDGTPMWYQGGENFDESIASSWNSAEQTKVGNRLPTYTGGLGTRVTWGGFFADANFYFSGGNKVYESWASYNQQTGQRSLLSYNGSQKLLERWQQPGDVTDVPKMRWSSSSTLTGSATSTRFLYDGDYVRLRDLVIGYNVSQKATDRLGFDSIQLNVKGTNLWTWVKDDDLSFDPEVSFGGGWNIYTPIIKSISVGLNLKF
ncbi:SusC/RagA family TonB-linked outer membrane protein [Flavobacteriaceae bacterium]|jgi:TonB-linked SusC/RagA family outer membrane protein|nr:SusC/RagA family TonB-linked outer membrane protein [Flavobacteriaceae bacterium]